MKVAVNKCFGGFSLSLKAQQRILELKGLPTFAYIQTKYSFREGQNLFEKVDLEKAEKDLTNYIFTVDMGESFQDFPRGEDTGYWYYGDIARTDKDLIQAIEEMGEEASGQCGDIRVIEVPDGIEFEITDYDGIETVREVGHSW